VSGDSRRGKAETWTPVLQENSRRSLSAPRPWLCAVTDIGRLRANNEDTYLLSDGGELWIVADGMGGHAAGEVASALTVKAIADAIYTSDKGPPSFEPSVHRARLTEAFAYASTIVFSHGLTNKECEGMGSTAIAGLMNGEALHLCHVGDARGYHLSKGKFRRVTNDHSLVWQLVMSGLLDSDQARLHPHRGRVTQAIGMASIRPDITSLMLKPADRVLLCSDGLWEALPEPEIAEIVASTGAMLELASMLVDRANAASGKDNITAVLYEHGARHDAVLHHG
jgi:PPM family protein phosphatase